MPIPEDRSSRCLTGTTWHKKSMLFYQNTEETASQQLFLHPGTVQAGIEPAVVISNSTNTCNPMDSEDLNLLVALHNRGKVHNMFHYNTMRGKFRKKLMNLSYIVCQKSMRNSNSRTVLFVYHR